MCEKNNCNNSCNYSYTNTILMIVQLQLKYVVLLFQLFICYFVMIRQGNAETIHGICHCLALNNACQ